jgi:exodeoxyribonuclease VII large subunit
MSSAPPRDVYSVSRLCVEANLVLEGRLPAVWMEGELSNVKRYPSGHWYFTVKDEVSQVSCTMWKSKTFRARVAPRDGLRVLVYGKAGVYAARGSFQFNVDYLEDAGEGELRRRFEELKAALAAEGLFDLAAKRPLPKLPRRIGLVTSPAGAAIRDILHILKRRFPSIPVVVYPVAVQGAGAAQEIARALKVASARAEVDVLILARGGGSLEDLWSFNEEVVARAIRACQIPVVAGVGHETDTTIADFAADLRAPTPSGAAEVVVPDQAEWRRTLLSHRTRLAAVVRRHLRSNHERLGFLQRRLNQAHPRHRLRDRIQRLDELESRLLTAWRRDQDSRETRLRWLSNRLAQTHPGRLIERQTADLSRISDRLERAITRQLDRYRGRFETAIRTLQAVSPLATVERGYAIVAGEDGAVLRDAGAAPIGSKIEVRLGQGRLRATVTERMD